MVMKFECIDVQHAQIATMRLKGYKRRTVRLGKAVITESESDRIFCKVYCEAMAYTCQPSDQDVQQLEREYEQTR